MADSNLQEAVLDALKHYNDLAGLQASPLSKLDGLWPLPPSVAGGLLASQATGLAVRRLLDQGLERLRQTWVEALVAASEFSLVEECERDSSRARSDFACYLCTTQEGHCGVDGHYGDDGGRGGGVAAGEGVSPDADVAV